MNLIEASLIAERCQRNWDYSKPISQQDIDTLVSVAVNMPTKQNLEYYDLVVSTSRQFNEICYASSFNPDDPYYNNEIGMARNSQVNAPLLLIWIPKLLDQFSNQERLVISDNSNTGDFLPKNIDTAIGVSAGSTALAAAQLGLKTGFCSCMYMLKVYESAHVQSKDPIVLEISKKLAETQDGLFLGIGYPNKSYDRKDVLKDDKLFTTVGSYDKQIKVTYIN